MHFFRNPCALPVAVIVGRPLVRSVPGAPFDREAFVDCCEVIADVSVEADFLGFFGACIGELAVAIGCLAIVLENSWKGAGDGIVVRAPFVVLAVDVHPGDRQFFVLAAAVRFVNVVVGHGVGDNCTNSFLEFFTQGVGVHGTETESCYEYTAGVDAVVFFHGGEQLVKEYVVFIAEHAPRHAVRIAVWGNEDVVAFLV